MSSTRVCHAGQQSQRSRWSRRPHRRHDCGRDERRRKRRSSGSGSLDCRRSRGNSGLDGFASEDKNHSWQQLDRWNIVDGSVRATWLHSHRRWKGVPKIALLTAKWRQSHVQSNRLSEGPSIGACRHTLKGVWLQRMSGIGESLYRRVGQCQLRR